MRYAVTGGCGFIGSHIVNALAARGEDVLAIDDLSGCINTKNVEASKYPNQISIVDVDCASLTGLSALRNFNPDVLIHAAANAREGASQFQPVSVTYRNLYAYVRVLTEFIKNGGNSVVLFSSMSVYGDQEPPFREDMPLKPCDVYAVNKSGMEQITDILADVHDFNYVIIRPHNVAGSKQALFDKFRNVVAIFMNRIMRNEPLIIYGDGEQERAFSYIGDSLPSFIKAVDSCMARELCKVVVNVGGKEHVTLNRLADVVIDAMGADKNYPRQYVPWRPREVKRAFSTYELSVQTLDYKEEIGWEQGVYEMAKWAKEQGPQEWRNNEPIELMTGNIPDVWRK